MKIFDCMETRYGRAELPGLRISADGREPVRECVATEHETMLILDGQPVLQLVCTPCQLAELALGRLYTGGYVRCTDEIDQITVCADGTRVEAELTHPFAPEGFAPSPLQSVTPISWDEAWVRGLTAYFEAGTGTPLFRATRSVHSATLAQDGNILYCCEDIGRHNAVDKVIGCALRDGVDLKKCVLFSSGRLPTDMVEKVIRAGIPVLCAKAACTDAAAALARYYGLTLLTNARGEAFTCVVGEKTNAGQGGLL